MPPRQRFGPADVRLFRRRPRSPLPRALADRGGAQGTAAAGARDLPQPAPRRKTGSGDRIKAGRHQDDSAGQRRSRPSARYGLAAAGLAAFGILWAEIGSVRDSPRAEVRENRAAIAEIAKGLARLEAVLQERLPKDR